MLAKKKKFYITTPIYYCNRVPHLGSAYTTIAADIIARYYRLRGEDVFFLTGLDEHGAKMAEAAEKAKKEPKDFCDGMARKFRNTWKALNINNNGFIRTTDAKHKKVVQEVLQRLWDESFIYKGEYKGLYCVGCERYLTKVDLVDGKCPDHQRKPELLKEESYFFKLSKFQPELLEKIKKAEGEFVIEPLERRNEMISFLEKQKLRDVAISRKKVKWGIKLPFDTSHTAYVWVDAFLNYLSGIGWKGDLVALPEFWPPDIQLMAKDILRVHATIWPGLLMALKIPLPKKLFVHGFFTVNGQKMSKSLGNVIDPTYLVKKYGVDPVRYFLFREISFGHDGDVSEERLKERYNSDLANGIGNLLSRTLTMAEKYWEGTVPDIDINKTGVDYFSRKSKEDLRRCLDDIVAENFNLQNRDWSYILRHHSLRCWKLQQEAIEAFDLNEALAFAQTLAHACDAYIEHCEIYSPSKKLGDSKEKINIALYDVLETIRHIAWLLLPFMPDTADKIFEQLGLDPEKEKKKKFEEATKWGGLKPGTKIKKGKPLFPRL